MGSPLRVFCKFFLPALLLMPAPALAQPSDLVPRHVPEKPIRTRVGPDQDAARVIVKFRRAPASGAARAAWRAPRPSIRPA